MTGINDLQKESLIFSISKYTWNKAAQAYLFLLQKDYYLTLRDKKEMEDWKKATLRSAHPPKFPSMSFYDF